MKKIISMYNKHILLVLSFVAALLLIFAVTPAFAFENFIPQTVQEENPEISEQEIQEMQELKKQMREERKNNKSPEDFPAKESSEDERNSREEITYDKYGNIIFEGNSDIDNDEYSNDVLGNYSTDGGSTWTDFTSESKLQEIVEDKGYKNLEINIWKDIKLGSRLCISKDQTVNLHLHGNVIDRGKFDDYSNKGEIFNIQNNSHLIIIGSENDEEASKSRSLGGYSKVEDTTWSTETYSDIKGGVVCHGGDWDGGGGFHYSADNGHVKLIRTTVFGCLAYGRIGDGHGGGACFYNDNCLFEMEESTIERCGSTNEGGVFYVADDMVGNNIILTNSHIKYNCCGDEGGVFYDYGGNNGIYGDAVFGDTSSGSVIEHNHSDQEGGAMCFYLEDNTSSVVQGLNFIANDSDDGGGAICVESESVSISNCNFVDNQTDNDGGAIDNEDTCTISDCYIVGNKADSEGGGVFVDDDVDLSLSGTIICRDNWVGSSEQDIYLDTFGVTTAAYIAPSVTNASNIGVYRRSFDLDRAKRATLDPGGYNEYCFFSNNNEHRLECSRSDYHLWFNYNKSGDDKKDHEFKWEERTPSYTDVTYRTGTYNDEPVYRGTTSYSMMTYSDEAMSTYYYYSDGFFKDDPSKYNEHLASCSMAFEISCSKHNEDLGDGSGNLDYSRKFTNLAQVFADIGCDQQKIYANDFYFQQPTQDSIGCAIASKPLSYDEDTLLVPIVVRGMGYESEWGSNAFLDASGPHAGFKKAADIVVANVAEYILLNDLGDKVSNGKVKFWIMGHSRAGATSNLAAKLLTDKYCANGNKVFCYTFEPPYCAVCPIGTKTPEDVVVADYTYQGRYLNIHNTINACDPVIYIPHPLLWYKQNNIQYVFTRYGISHFIPGEAGEDGEEDYLKTEYFDNKKLKATWNDSTSQYVVDRNKMIEQLTATNQYEYFSDYFHSAELNPIKGTLGFARMLEVSGDLKDGEEFIQDLMDELFLRAISLQREVYVSEHGINGENYPSFQTGLCDALRIFMGKNPREFSELAGSLSSIMNNLGMFDKITILWDLRDRVWSKLSDDTRKKVIDDLITALFKKVTGPDITDYLTEEEINTLKSDFVTLVDCLFNFVSDDAHTDRYDIDREGFPILASTIFNVGRLFSSHFPEVSLAWVRAYDSYYDNLDDKIPIKIVTDDIEEPSKPKINYEGDVHEDWQEQLDLDSSNTFQLFTNDNTASGVNHNGDVIYYNLEKTDNPDDVLDPLVTSKAKHYQSDISIHRAYSADVETETYYLKARSVSYGKFSELATFKIVVHNGYEIIVYSGEEQSNDITYKRIIYGKPVVLATDEIYNNQHFDHWQISYSGASHEDVTDIAFAEGNGSKNINTTWFYMLDADLEAKPIYGASKDSVINLVGDNIYPRLNTNLCDNSYVEYTIGDQTFNNLDEVELTWTAYIDETEVIPFSQKVEPYQTIKLDFDLHLNAEKGIYFDASKDKTKIKVNKQDVSDYSITIDNVNNILHGTCTFSDIKTEFDTAHYNDGKETQKQVLGSEVSTVEDLKTKFMPETIKVATEQDGEVDLPSSTVDWDWEQIKDTQISEWRQDIYLEGTVDTSRFPSYMTDEHPTLYPPYWARVIFHKSQVSWLKYPEIDVLPGEYSATESEPLVINLSTDQPDCDILYNINGDPHGYKKFDPANPIKLYNESSTEDVTFNIEAICRKKDGSSESWWPTWSFTMKKHNPIEDNTINITYKDSSGKVIDEKEPLIYRRYTDPTIIADNVDGYQFVKWKDVSIDPIIEGGETSDRIVKLRTYDWWGMIYNFEAIYTPIIQDLNIQIAPPDPAEEKSGYVVSANITTPDSQTNTNVKDYINLSWVEENNALLDTFIPKFDTQYLAILELESTFFDDYNYYSPRFLNAKVVDYETAKKFTSGNFVLNKEGTSYVSSIVVNSDTKRVPKCKLLSIGQVEPMTYPTHTPLENIINDLPNEVSISTEGYLYKTAPVEWNTESVSPPYDPSSPEDQSFEIQGKVNIPKDIDVNGISTDVVASITVEGLERCDVPACFPSDSLHNEDINIYLYSKTGDNEIYYSISKEQYDPNGTIMTAQELEWTKFDKTNPPLLDTPDNTITYYKVNCYTATEDPEVHRDSDVATYDFTIDKILIPCETLNIFPNGADITVNQSFRFETEALPPTSTDKKVVYESSNPDVVNVNIHDGICYGLNVGSTIITARTTRGTAEVSCVVNVLPANHMFNSISADTWMKNSDVVVQYDIAAESNRFSQLIIDGKIVDSDCYEIDIIPLPEPELHNGKVNAKQYDPKIDSKAVIRLLPDYLETLNLGNHSIDFKFNDGSAFTNLNVCEKILPEVFDNFAVGQLSDNVASLPEKANPTHNNLINNNFEHNNIWLIVLISLFVVALLSAGVFATIKYYKKYSKKH